MLSFKGVLKYTLYLFVAAWMFVLGIMVGRGTSPVNFDTHGFQKRLENIAAQFGKKDAGAKPQMELKFYDVLDQPVTAAKDPGIKKTSEIIPVADKPKTQENKFSTKKKTLKANVKATDSPAPVPVKKNEPVQVKKEQSPEPEKQKKNYKPPADKGTEGKYTIQIAAYKDFKDAVSQMASLEKLGISSYRVKAVKDGVTWYRVRTGSFETLETARKYKAQLNLKKINGMIIKKAEI